MVEYSNLRTRFIRRSVTVKPVVEPALERFLANLYVLYDGELPPTIASLVHDLVEHFEYDPPKNFAPSSSDFVRAA